MIVRLLGTAAGGGFPQWNCACRGCALARRDQSRAKPRSQASVAISQDGQRWLLVNASPDIRTQIESFSPLVPTSGRGTGIKAVLLTTADLDHALGLFVLREGRRLNVYATEAVQKTLEDGLRLNSVLGSFCGIDWKRPPGSNFTAFPIGGKAPRYASASASEGHTVGYKFVDDSTGATIVVACDVGRWDDTLRDQVRGCDLLLLDGTFWADDDMVTAGVGSARASQMAHWPLSGPQGSLAEVSALRPKRTVLIHVNNTNPILIEDSPQRSHLRELGVEVGEDGREITL